MKEEVHTHKHQGADGDMETFFWLSRLAFIHRRSDHSQLYRSEALFTTNGIPTLLPILAK